MNHMDPARNPCVHTRRAKKERIVIQMLLTTDLNKLFASIPEVLQDSLALDTWKFLPCLTIETIFDNSELQHKKEVSPFYEVKTIEYKGKRFNPYGYPATFTGQVKEIVE